MVSAMAEETGKSDQTKAAAADGPNGTAKGPGANGTGASGAGNGAAPNEPLPKKPPPDETTVPSFDHIGVLGHVGWLLSQSKDHRDGFIADLEWRVMPPVALGQFKIWTRRTPAGGAQPVAYASWAFVSDRVAAKLKDGRGRLAPADWKSGSNKVIVDVITPFGGRKEVIKELEK